jgi:hypothetical protein
MSKDEAEARVRFWGEMLVVAKRSPDQAAVPYWQSLYDKGHAILADSPRYRPTIN